MDLFHTNDLSSGALAQFDKVCDRFEEAWNQGKRPTIEAYLSLVAPEQSPILLRALMEVELDLIRQQGKQADLHHYQQRFPDQGEIVRAAFAGRRSVREDTSAECNVEVNLPLARLAPRDAKVPCAAELPLRSQAAVRLEVTDGPHQGLKIEFDRHDTFLVGRSRDAHLRLNNDPHFSRNHFRMEINPPDCYLIDLDSQNGTFVNGLKVQNAFLKDGDLISGGKTKIRFAALHPTHRESLEASTLAVPAVPELRLQPNAHSPVSHSASPAPAPPVPIQSVPGYEVLWELGRGGMGVVYRAIRKATGSNVALKVIVPAHSVTSEALQLFLREASILSQLDHPRIVRFQEMGFAAGQLYYAMDFVETVSPQEVWADRSSASRTRTACGILCQILDALAYAHAQSLVHRDVKPANILLTLAGRKLRSKLADFGIAKNYVNAGFSELTQEGEARGSLAFMPPEQIINSRDARPSCDIYSAGATLYQYLSGELPFDFSSRRSKFKIVLEEEPVPLSNHLPDLSRDLEAIVHRALAKNPSDRFPSAQAMRKALLPFARRK